MLGHYIKSYIKEFKNHLFTFWNYKEPVFYLLRKKGLRAAYNFIYVKLFVEYGEGSLGVVPNLIYKPLYRIFPKLAPYLTPYPRKIEIEMTTKCNKKCVICEHTYWKKEEQEQRHLTFNEFRHIVDQFPKLKWVNLTGEGDAFLNPDYLKMIAYLKKKDIPVFLVDSFDLIVPKTAEKLIKLGVDGIYISIDGATKETYEKMKEGCKFDRVMKNIKYLIDLKKKCKTPMPELCFRFVITTLNFKEMPKFIDLIASLGTKKDFGEGSRIEFVGLLYFDETKKYFVPNIPENIIKDTMRRGKKYGFKVEFAHSCEPQYLSPLEHCTNWVEPYIMMGGYVMPCCAVMMSNRRPFLRKYSMGNIFKEPFKKIWNSQKYRNLRKIVVDKKAKVPMICAGCRTYNTIKREKERGVIKE